MYFINLPKPFFNSIKELHGRHYICVFLKFQSFLLAVFETSGTCKVTTVTVAVNMRKVRSKRKKKKKKKGVFP